MFRFARGAFRRTGSSPGRVRSRWRGSWQPAWAPGAYAPTAGGTPSRSRRTTRPRAEPGTAAWRSRSTYRRATRRPARLPGRHEARWRDPQADLQLLGAAGRRTAGAGPARLVGRAHHLDQQLPPVRIGDGSLDPDRNHRAESRRAGGLAVRQGQARQRGADGRPSSRTGLGADPARRGGGGGGTAPAALRGGARAPEKASLRRRASLAVGPDSRARLAATTLQSALVRLHRRPGRRQDDRTDQLRAALPARGSARP